MLFIKASKAGLAKLLRDRGYDLPSIPKAKLAKVGRHSYTMSWADSRGGSGTRLIWRPAAESRCCK